MSEQEAPLRRNRTTAAQTLATPEATPAVVPGSDNTLPRGVSEAAIARRRAATNIGGFNKRLSAKPMPGFSLRFVNDIEGRIENFLALGWDYVMQNEQGIEQESTDPGKKVSRVVGSLPSGEPMRAYLLKIPEEWYKDDQKKEQGERAKVDEAIRRGLVGVKPGDKRYAPKEGISIKSQDR